jgi:hypothetical protein
MRRSGLMFATHDFFCHIEANSVGVTMIVILFRGVILFRSSIGAVCILTNALTFTMSGFGKASVGTFFGVVSFEVSKEGALAWGDYCLTVGSAHSDLYYY